MTIQAGRLETLLGQINGGHAAEALPELDCRFVAVPRHRGQQLKEPAQLDGWLRDGSAAYLESLGDW